MKNIVVFTGAGVSAESGIKTFRDSGGLWEEYDIMEVASIDAWHRNPKLVLDFYNARRKQLAECKPNAAHLKIAELEQFYDVQVITQNVDDLHERAGSKKIIHLHGELTKVRNEDDETEVLDWGYNELNESHRSKAGSRLRPHIVWFGEEVPMMQQAISLVRKADCFVVVGTSLNVYPAAGLIDYADHKIPKYIIDPASFSIRHINNIEHFQEPASSGMTRLFEKLTKV